MKFFKGMLITKIIAVTLIFFLTLLSMEKSVYAGMVGSRYSPETRGHDIDTIKRFLDNRIIEEKLIEWGYSKEELAKKLNELNDDELRFFASRAEALETGGDAVSAVLGFILALLLIALLVILILELTGHRVIVRTKK